LLMGCCASDPSLRLRWGLGLASLLALPLHRSWQQERSTRQVRTERLDRTLKQYVKHQRCRGRHSVACLQFGCKAQVD
jgi:hypothetical protein